DAPVEVAVHHVGAADPELVDAIEMDDPRVLEEPAEDRTDRDVLREALGARAQRADAAHHHLDAHTRQRSAIQRVDDLLVDQSVHLHPDPASTVFAVGSDFALDAFDDAGA